MKTLLVVIPEKVSEHVGEEYDDFIKVETTPSMESLDVEANRIWDAIKALGESDREDAKEARKKGELFEEKVVIYSDVSSPYNVVLVSLTDVMLEKDGIVVETPSVPEGGAMFKLAK